MSQTRSPVHQRGGQFHCRTRSLHRTSCYFDSRNIRPLVCLRNICSSTQDYGNRCIRNLYKKNNPRADYFFWTSSMMCFGSITKSPRRVRRNLSIACTESSAPIPIPARSIMIFSPSLLSSNFLIQGNFELK